jgi:hypothetical protein
MTLVRDQLACGLSHAPAWHGMAWIMGHGPWVMAGWLSVQAGRVGRTTLFTTATTLAHAHMHACPPPSMPACRRPPFLL